MVADEYEREIFVATPGRGSTGIHKDIVRASDFTMIFSVFRVGTGS